MQVCRPGEMTKSVLFLPMQIEIGPSVPRRGGRVSGWVGRRGLQLMGWRIVGAIPDQSKFVAIVAPHTSNWDFVVGILARYALRLDASWLGKHTLFHPP